jgi:hypothetical protein
VLSKPCRVSLCRMSALGSLSLVLAASAAGASFVTFFAGGTSVTSSIQGTVDAFRAALGGPNNGNNPGTVRSPGIAIAAMNEPIGTSA